jgi:predicted dehydrogenase
VKDLEEEMAEKETGFTTMAGPKGSGVVSEIGIGMLGYAFMGKAHTNAYKTLPYMMYPPPAIPNLVAIAGIPEDGVQEAARRYGYANAYTDWHQLLDNAKVQLFDNCGPNGIHGEPTILAAKAGKHVMCEKPLARNAEEACEMVEAVTQANVKNMVGFNYRFVPAIRLARELIETGKLGQIYHFRASYLQEWIMPHYGTPAIWRLDKKQAGSGALGDLGAHIIDLAHYLVGDIKGVSAMAKTFIDKRDGPEGKLSFKVEVDDAFVSCVEFANGAIGTLEASRFGGGHKNGEILEINGEKGSIKFNLERLNELEVFWIGEEPKSTQGFRNVSVTEGSHPFYSNWWPHGHIIGWEHTFIHELTHLIDCIVNGKDVAPYGATFNDGYRAAVVCDAILKSAESKKQIDVKY